MALSIDEIVEAFRGKVFDDVTFEPDSPASKVIIKFTDGSELPITVVDMEGGADFEISLADVNLTRTGPSS